MGSISMEEVFALGHQLCDPSISKRDTSLRSKSRPDQRPSGLTLGLLSKWHIADLGSSYMRLLLVGILITYM